MPSFSLLWLPILWWIKLFRKMCPLSFRYVCNKQGCSFPCLFFCALTCSVLPWLFHFCIILMFHADYFFFFMLVTDLRHLTAKNSFLNPFSVFPFLSKAVLYSNSGGGSLLHFVLNSNRMAAPCKRKTWWPSFKLLQCFNLAVLDGRLIAGGLQWEVLALFLASHAISCHPAATRCRLLPFWQSLHLSSASGVFPDRTPSPELFP